MYGKREPQRNVHRHARWNPAVRPVDSGYIDTKNVHRNTRWNSKFLRTAIPSDLVVKRPPVNPAEQYLSSYFPEKELPSMKKAANLGGLHPCGNLPLRGKMLPASTPAQRSRDPWSDALRRRREIVRRHGRKHHPIVPEVR